MLEKTGKNYTPANVLGELSAAEKRLWYISNLAPYEVQVWGDEGWHQLDAHGVNYRGSAGHLYELTKIYNAATIHVDIGRIYQSDIVTMRVFDVLACGGFLLAEYSEGLEELFKLGQELVCYRDLNDLTSKVEYYLAHPDEAHAIAERGRARVERDHTIAQRLQQMLKAMSIRAPSRAPILIG
jgi:spore maturation protein CgeB